MCPEDVTIRRNLGPYRRKNVPLKIFSVKILYYSILSLLNYWIKMRYPLCFNLVYYSFSYYLSFYSKSFTRSFETFLKPKRPDVVTTPRHPISSTVEEMVWNIESKKGHPGLPTFTPVQNWSELNISLKIVVLETTTSLHTLKNTVC